MPCIVSGMCFANENTGKGHLIHLGETVKDVRAGSLKEKDAI